MRQLYSYQTIRYFPHILSDEFINVGVILNSANRVRILSEEEAKSIYCSALIGEKKRFLALIEHLHKLTSDNVLLEKHYFHNFRFSEEKTVASEKREDELLEELFEDYIGFKIHNEKKQELKQIIYEQSIYIIEKEFKSYIRFKKSKQFDFELENIKKQIKHYSNIGRISRKDDVMQMAFATPRDKPINERYDFLDMTGQYNLNSHYAQKLEQNFVEIYPYKTEEDMGKYLEIVAGKAA